MTPSGGPGPAFDKLAPDYDRRFTDTAFARTLRRRVWSHLDRSFGPGDHVVDLGCGSGEDAVHLAARGVIVTALDAAPAMAAQTKRKVESMGQAGRVRVLASRMEDLGLAADRPPLDGAFADFGALNCVADRPRLGRELAARLRPGATLIAVMMGPICPLEMLWHLAHGSPRKAVRRLGRRGARAQIAGHAFQVRYPSPARLGRDLAPAFRLEWLEGLGAVLPPTYASARFESRPAALRRLDRLDMIVGRTLPAVYLADHYIARFRAEP